MKMFSSCPNPFISGARSTAASGATILFAKSGGAAERPLLFQTVAPVATCWSSWLVRVIASWSWVRATIRFRSSHTNFFENLTVTNDEGPKCGHDCAHRSVAHAGRAVCETAELYLPAALSRRFERIRGLACPHRRRAAGEACDQHADLSLPAWRADLGLSLSQDDPGVSGRWPSRRGAGLSGLWTIRQASQGCGLHVWFPPRHVATVDRAARSSKRHARRAGLGGALGSPPAHGNAKAVQAFVGDERHDCGGRKSKCRLRQLESLCQSQSGLRRRALDAAHHAGLERSGSRSLLRAVS